MDINQHDFSVTPNTRDKKKNFLDLPSQYSDLNTARIAVIPVPFDETATWKKGAANGPAAIIEASSHLELYDIETGFESCTHGIYTYQDELELSSPEIMITSVEHTVRDCLEKGLFPVIIGGEHSVSLGGVKAIAHSVDHFSVLQLDAHTDLRDTYQGSRFNHACVMARIKEICPVVQAGIRSMDISEQCFLNSDRTFFARDIYSHSDWYDSVLDLLSDKVYITVDLDVFDPSIMPSTGTPEPGGLGWYDVTGLLKRIFCEKKVLGCDVVELCPDTNHSADFLAAKLVYKMISYFLFYTDFRGI